MRIIDTIEEEPRYTAVELEVKVVPTECSVVIRDWSKPQPRPKKF